MSDYRRAKVDNKKLRKPEAICAEFCFNHLPVDLDADLEYPEIYLVFDRGERFHGTITNIWQQYRKKPDAGWPKQIKDIVPNVRLFSII
jgi:hypothetical protein